MKLSSLRLKAGIQQATAVLGQLQSLARSKIARQLGYMVLASTLILVVWLIVRNYQQFKLLITGFHIGWVVASFLLITACLVILAESWYQILCGYGIERGRYPIIRMYFLTGIGRYLPGGVWHFGGRMVWLEQLSTPLKISTEALLTEQIGVLWLGAVMGAGFVLAQFVSVAILVVAAGILIGLWWWVVRHRFLTYNINLSEQRVVFLIGRYLVFWLVYGLSIYALVLASGQPFDLAEMVKTIGYACLSWVAGYVVIFVPGGVGIREGALAGSLNGFMPLPVAGTIALLSRGMSIAAEVILVLIFIKKRS